MAAIVTGLIPLLSTAVKATTTYKGRSVWFGLLCIRLVTLFVAEMPWFHLGTDFTCNITTGVCTKDCFNQHFDKPVLIAWNFLFILLVLSVILMELFTAHVRTVLQKQIMRNQKTIEVESLGELRSAKVSASEVMILDMHGSMNAVLAYLFSMILRIVVEVWFAYILFFWNLPKLSQASFLCNARNHGCPALHCLVSATSEKSMSIYALLSTSFLIIVVSCAFCLYLIAHYIFKCCTQHHQCVT